MNENLSNTHQHNQQENVISDYVDDVRKLEVEGYETGI